MLKNINTDIHKRFSMNLFPNYAKPTIPNFDDKTEGQIIQAPIPFKLNYSLQQRDPSIRIKTSDDVYEGISGEAYKQEDFPSDGYMGGDGII